MDWRIKGVIQKALGAVPGGVSANDMLQRIFGEIRRFELHMAGRVNDWAIIAGHVRNQGFDLQGLRLVEIGTGWFPALPVCFSLAGVASCITYDLNVHLDRGLTRRMIAGLGKHLEKISEVSGRDLKVIREEFARLESAANTAELLRSARIDYRAPADATATTLDDQSVDVVFSNGVLAHVPPTIIERMMQESARILRDGGLTLHSVDCNDMYAHFDRSITRLNYLRYSEKEWRFWNNRMLYQNRLRPRDLTDMAKRAGLEILIDRPTVDMSFKENAKHVATAFKEYPIEDLCTVSFTFGGTPARDGFTRASAKTSEMRSVAKAS